MAGVREKQGQLVFGLDIGTRSIVGTVGQLSGGKFRVMAQRSKEHETRAMLDGQIHDIGKVAESITLVKQQLEEDLGRELTDVCIAAAGRVLRTVTTYVEQSFDNEKEINEEDIYALSTLGVEKAYEEFQNSNDTDVKFYCVGYTPMRYYMNGYQIGNLEGHKAKTIAIDLIGTFLPDDVVDGLYKAVELAGLRVANLTLEPIAAIQVAIPEKFRMLNMALVDVGAGTSDICITKDGTITAYGMIPVAGDSLTEIIVQHCLVEFETAEKIKRAAGNQDIIEYEDIIGLPQTITAAEVLNLLAPAVETMAKQVAEGIRNLNGDKPVSAVFVVGGGGMVPGYTECLAGELGIVKERVAIRGKEVMQNIEFEISNARKDSMMVTPIGICYSYYEQSNNFIFVEFNKTRIKLYDNGRLTIADAAVQSQFPNEDLFPKRGAALTYTVNGKSHMTRGQLGETSMISLNGMPADMYTQIHNGDSVEVKASTAGEAASLKIGGLAEFSQPLHVFVNGTEITLPRQAVVGDRAENEFYEIQDGDVIEIHNYYTVQEIAALLDVPLGGDIKINDAPARRDTRVYENFTVSWSEEPAKEEEELRVQTEEEEESQAQTEETERKADKAEDAGESVTPSEPESVQSSAEESEKNTVSEQAEEPVQEGKPSETVASQIYVIVNRQSVTLSGKKSYVFVDVFDFIDFDLKRPAGRSIVTTLNGKPAEYMQALHNGDVIEIYWSKKDEIM
ncbi:MAG: rod shape-determining protein [Roseburia sp.]|nr:rod shape-determining protein [Roseburia sp.]